MVYGFYRNAVYVYFFTNHGKLMYSEKYILVSLEKCNALYGLLMLLGTECECTHYTFKHECGLTFVVRLCVHMFVVGCVCMFVVGQCVCVYVSLHFRDSML